MPFSFLLICVMLKSNDLAKNGDFNYEKPGSFGLQDWQPEDQMGLFITILDIIGYSIYVPSHIYLLGHHMLDIIGYSFQCVSSNCYICAIVKTLSSEMDESTMERGHSSIHL